MSNKAINWARDIELPPGEKTALMMLANSFNEKKGYCYPTNKTLAKWCGCKDRTIRRYIKSLISKNLIQKIGEIRNHKGHRETTKYSLNFDQKLDSLPDNNACGQLPSLPDNYDTPTGQINQPTGQIDRCAPYILNQSKTKRETFDFSLDDENEQQKLEIIVAVNFGCLVKFNGDTYDLENARRLHKKICLEDKYPEQMAENLLTARKQQKLDRDKLIKAGEFVPALCSLTNWLDGKRWLDVIKPIGQKKKVSPYIKCKTHGCREEALRHQNYCTRCTEMAKPRMQEAAYA